MSSVTPPNGLAARWLERQTPGMLREDDRKRGGMKAIVCGVDGSPGSRAALRVAASLAEELRVRLVAVHVLDRLAEVGPTAERVAASVLYDETPDARAESRGEVGDVAERLAAVARDEGALMIVLGARSRGRSRTFLRARCAAELAELTDVPVLVAPQQLAAHPALPQLSNQGGFS
jgi:nucleotide-binding universal stress UspA family protein